MNINDKYGLGLGFVSAATFNADSALPPNYATINVTVVNQTVPNDNAFSIPHAFPYGLISLPPNDTYALTMNIAGTTMSPVVIGNIPAYSNLYPIMNLSVGESALYSGTYALQAKVNALKAQFANANGQFTATMLWGENITTVLIAILDYLTDSMTGVNAQLLNFQSALSSHTHAGPFTGDTAPPTNAPYNQITDIATSDPALAQYQAELAAGNGYVNDDGKTM